MSLRSMIIEYALTKNGGEIFMRWKLQRYKKYLARKQQLKAARNKTKVKVQPNQLQPIKAIFTSFMYVFFILYDFIMKIQFIH